MPAGLWGQPGKIGQIDHALQMHFQYSAVEFIRLWEKKSNTLTTGRLLLVRILVQDTLRRGDVRRI